MANHPYTHYLYLDELYPVEVFKILLAAARKDNGRFLEYIGVIIPANSIYGTLAVLAVPDTSGSKASADEDGTHVFTAAVNAYRDIKERDPQPSGDEAAKVPLLEGIARLLLAPMPAGYKKNRAPKVDEYMVVSRNLDQNAASRLFQQLSLHATHTRVAGVQWTDGNRYLFNVKDDHKRRSSFLSLQAAEFLSGCQVLQGLSADKHHIYLPADIEPDAIPEPEELKLFCNFVVAAPQLFGRGNETIPEGPLVAVSRWPVSPTGQPDAAGGDDVQISYAVELLFIPGLTFYGQSTFNKPRAGFTAFVFHDLAKTEMNLETLQHNLHQSAANVGYRLELRPTRHIESKKADRLYEEKARVEYQLAYLESITRPRPVLFRFTQQQLPAMADVIRNFPMKVLYDGGLKYGFQATTYEPEGMHFILAEPNEAVMNGLDPILLWQDLDIPPMRFHLDPSWARYYYERGSALVFVPEGSALFPVMHDWDHNSMDRYLRETMGQWFQNAPDQTAIPEHPIYIFDGLAKPGAAIRISLLDRKAMKPLHTRLGWLNDNLSVLHAVGVENLITQMARDVSWQELYKHLMQEADAIRGDFENTIADSSQYMAQTVHAMTATLTEEINRTVEKTFQMVQFVQEMDQEVKKWQNACAGMKSVLKEVKEKEDSAIQHAVKSNSEFYTLIRQIDYEISNAQAQRADVEKKVSIEINKLKEKYQFLKEKLKRLR